MSPLRGWLVLFLVVSTLASEPATAQEILTNESVVTMKNAGLSDSVIMARIRSGPTNFNVGTTALIALKRAGVSDPVIEAMVARSTAPSLPPPTPDASPTVGAPVPGELRSGRDAVFHLRGDTYLELMPALSSMETNFAPFSRSSELVLKGRKSSYRITDRSPVFFSSVAPTEMPLVRLRPGNEHDDRNLNISGGGFGPWGGTLSFGVRTQDMIDVAWEKDPRGFYRVTPRQPLPPGEYGFVHTHGLAARAAGRVFDFGVD